MKQYNDATSAVHGDAQFQSYSGPVLDPIHSSTTFQTETAEELEKIFRGEAFGHVYSRISNPTVSSLEQKINVLEGGIGAVALSSGMSAISNAFLAILDAGDHVVASKSLFAGTYALLNEIFPRWGIEATFVDATDEEAITQAFRPNTKLFFIETIGNPKLDVPDIAHCAKIAHEHSVPLIVDHTAATTYLCHPLKMGADVVIHSTSKFIAGSGQAIGGMIVDGGTFPFGDYPDKYPSLGKFFDRFGPFSYLARIRKDLMVQMGSCLSPQVAFLQLVGCTSLFVRMERHCQNALEIAQYLEQKSEIDNVRYPGLQSHESYEYVQKNFNGHGGALITFDLGSKDRVCRWMNACRIIRKGPNLGDAKTLMIHPAHTIYHFVPESEYDLVGISRGMIRIAVGIEDVRDLIEDFERGFAAL